MNKREAVINRIFINSIGYSSVFDIGDVHISTPITRALAVQKYIPVFNHEHLKYNFEDYPIFSRKTNLPTDRGYVQKETVHHSPSIHVNNVNINAVSSSSIIQVGSMAKIDSEARIKHIRLIPERTN